MGETRSERYVCPGLPDNEVSMLIGELEEPLRRFIERQVAEGRYRTETDVIRDALYLLQEQDEQHDPLTAWSVEELRREIQVGIDSGPDVAAEEVFERLRDRYRRMAESQPKE
jgi:antitoxin ParD1/3/4